MRMSKGIRNNNPFNIRYNNFNHWKGLIGQDKDGFCIFYSMDFGLRAGIVLLRTYIKRYHLTDVSSIIKRFAPPSENNTHNYISFVRSELCFNSYDPDDIKFGTFAFCQLVCAICMYESWYRISVEEVINIIHKFNL